VDNGPVLAAEVDPRLIARQPPTSTTGPGSGMSTPGGATAGMRAALAARHEVLRHAIETHGDRSAPRLVADGWFARREPKVGLARQTARGGRLAVVTRGVC
jgi:hypothetical protein